MDVLQLLNGIWHVVLAGFFALLPGAIFWLTVLGLYLAIRWIGRRTLFRRRSEELPAT